MRIIRRLIPILSLVPLVGALGGCDEDYDARPAVIRSRIILEENASPVPTADVVSGRAVSKPTVYTLVETMDGQRWWSPYYLGEPGEYLMVRPQQVGYDNGWPNFFNNASMENDREQLGVFAEMEASPDRYTGFNPRVADVMGMLSPESIDAAASAIVASEYAERVKDE